MVTLSRGALVLCALLALAPLRASAQTVTITTAGDLVTLRAPGWTFLSAGALARLKEGRTVRVELAAVVLAAPARPPVTTVRQVFALSYDLWEERFAITAASGHAAVSHLTEAAAAAWGLEHLPIPIGSLGGAASRFFIRVECRILDGDDPAGADDEGLTLQRLIDVFSRRRRSEPAVRPLEGGPFGLPR